MSEARVTVIISTMCEAARRVSLLRAIGSVRSQDVPGVVLLVVNGMRFDAELLEQLKADPGLRVEYRQEGSLPGAVRYGRSLVTTEFFSFLDDDDEYLPGALRTRIEPLLADATLDVVATNGYRGSGEQHIYLDKTDHINRDPLTAIIGRNWLASCGGLFRSTAIGVDYFDGKTKHFEWTLLAYRILFANRRVLFVDVPTFRVNDSPDSLSKSLEYQRASAAFYQHLLTLQPPARIRRALRRELSAAWHDLSEQYRRSGERARAWQCHWRSLIEPDGLRYLLYTRWLLLPSGNP